MELLINVIVGLLALISGVVGYYFYVTHLNKQKRDEAQKEVERILNRARSQATKIERDSEQRAKDFEIRARKNIENDIRKQKQSLQNQENSYRDKEQRLDKEHKRKEERLLERSREVEDREEKLKVMETRVQESEGQIGDQISALREKLQAVANMTAEQAKEELKRAIENDAKNEAATRLKKIEQDAEKEANERARRVVAVAVARYASEVATERTVTSVALTSDEMKGKIIGREGRNIRALEAACGVDLIVDETPEAVIISCFDPIRREVARLTLEKLMEDGRVHPARIEEVVSRVKNDLFATIRAQGEKACVDLGLSGLNPALLNLIGTLKYRQSEMQNLYDHSIEVGYIAGLMAEELGTDVTAAKRAGLLHDIGKGLDHTVEGSHAVAGADFAKRHGEKDGIVHAIRAHHNDAPAETVLAHIVQAANNLSKARPGARRNMMEGYIRRMADLESVANSFDGVQRTFAIQSGKEIRVLVDSGKITDDQSQMLSRDIARKIERELNYPGQVKVTVVRETRIVEHAR